MGETNVHASRYSTFALMLELPLAWWLEVSTHWRAEGAFVSIVIAECSIAATGIVLFRRGRWAK